MKSTFVSCGDSQWDSRTGETAEILHQLGPDKVDMVDVGPMFRIRFCDGVETDAFLHELPDLEKYRFCEVIFDITTCIGGFVREGAPAENKEYDSRDLYAHIFKWAQEFENGHRGDEYMIQVEEFASERLRGYFGLDA